MFIRVRSGLKWPDRDEIARTIAIDFIGNKQAILTELCVSFDSSDILSTLNGLSKYGKLRFFIRTDEATKDRAPERV